VTGAGTGYRGPGADTFAGTRNVQGGEGNDVATGAAWAKGGHGDDRLSGGPALMTWLWGDEGDDVISDGAAEARIVPGPGRDTVTAGGDRDVVYDDDTAPGADRLDGGGGRDTLVLSHRREPARVDLGAQTSSDGDAIAGWENVTGGHGDDALDAGAGDDVVDAHATSDWWSGQNEGRDVRYERVTCGTGRDRVQDVFDDVVSRSCERLAFGGTRLHPAAVRGRGAAFAVGCPRFVGRRCRGELAVERAAVRRPDRRFRRIRTPFVLPRRGGRIHTRLPRASALRIRVRFRGSEDTYAKRWIVLR
jgi:hypothetical protein